MVKTKVFRSVNKFTLKNPWLRLKCRAQDCIMPRRATERFPIATAEAGQQTDDGLRTDPQQTDQPTAYDWNNVQRDDSVPCLTKSFQWCHRTESKILSNDTIYFFYVFFFSLFLASQFQISQLETLKLPEVLVSSFLYFKSLISPPFIKQSSFFRWIFLLYLSTNFF